MTEQDYISKLKSRWPRNEPGNRETSPETLAISEEALRFFPDSAILWDLRGNLIELALENCPVPLDEALACYKKAIELAPTFAEAWEDAAHFYDAILNDERSAEPFFAEFNRLKGI